MERTETMVRMGELAVSSVPGHVLVSLGLGSCIGLAMVDRRLAIVGLAHVVLPASESRAQENPRKFADLAVPELVAALEAAGARRIRLEAVLVGGASMFAVSNAGLDVGRRNEAAVRELLEALRIPVAASATGGVKGRTIRVDVATAAVTVREAGGRDEPLLNCAPLLEAVA
jgi:chemotaxis protein CheD